MPHEGAVADFLASQLARREAERIREADEKRRREEQRALTNRANLGFLLVTWRFILVTRAAFFALAGAGLSHILQNIASFLDTTRIIPVFETLFGRETVIFSMVRLITPAQAGILVAAVIASIAICSFAIDVMLSRLQAGCVKIGVASEKELEVHGLFSEIHRRGLLISIPYYIVRFAIVAVGLTALWYLTIGR